MRSAIEIANYFVELASEIDENDLTNLKLQKLLYFAQGKYLVKTGKALFKESIEAWQYGPVVRDVYMNFKSCGSFPITAFDRGVEKTNLDKETVDFLKKIWGDYAVYSANFLVALTHEEGSPWEKTYDPKADKEIPLALMKEYFEKK